MPRRRDASLFRLIVWTFRLLPGWLGLLTIAAAYWGVQVGLRAVTERTRDPFLAHLPEVGPYLGFAVVCALFSAWLIAALQRWRRRRLVAIQTGIESIRELSWENFERLVGQAYREQGYRVEETGLGGPDGGVDLRLRKGGRTVLVQCKQYRTWKVGAPAVREFYGVLVAEEADRGIFVTSGVYTSAAIDFAEGKPIELIDGEGLFAMIRPELGSALEEQEEEEPIPDCPECGEAMVLKAVRKGAKAGTEFWSCTGFPRCRGTRPVE